MPLQRLVHVEVEHTDGQHLVLAAGRVQDEEPLPADLQKAHADVGALHRPGAGTGRSRGQPAQTMARDTAV